MARLDDLDKEEININKQLRNLQLELNGIVPVKDRVKVKKEYFDNIPTDELIKHQDNNKNDIEDEEEMYNENIEGLKNEEDEHKKNKKKKIQFDTDTKKQKKNNKKRKK